jgi:hypothetical protein
LGSSSKGTAADLLVIRQTPPTDLDPGVGIEPTSPAPRTLCWEYPYPGYLANHYKHPVSILPHRVE